MSRSIFFSSFLAVAEAMEKTYRALGEDEAAAAFRREGRTFSAAAFREDPNAEAAGTLEAGETQVRAEKRERRSSSELTKLDFSVIVPTCDRSATLAQCLKALDGQSLSPYRFEVIVVDDGSTDHTRELCQAHKPRYEFHYLHRQNGGAGAARCMGVEKARGKYLLLMNDDTIASRELLAGHLVQQRAHASDKVAVLGDFKYPAEARNRALTWFLHTSPFLFPQVTLKAGIHTSHSLFVTCNISVRRDAVEAAGSFDETFRVAEDTDLGIRLVQRGLRILYAPELAAEHRHLKFTIADLLRRAEIYGKTLVNLYEKHPSLLVAGQDPFGDLGPAAIAKLRSFLTEHEESVPRATESLAKFDTVDFSSFFGREIDGRNAADEVMNLFARSIPILYWYRLFRSFLAAGRIAGSDGAAVPCSDLVPQPADA
jgi:GT2 family glycosyltransferase